MNSGHTLTVGPTNLLLERMWRCENESYQLDYKAFGLSDWGMESRGGSLTCMAPFKAYL